MKSCSKCGIQKALTEFPKRIDSPDGYRNHCKLCRKSYNQEYQKQNHTQLRNYKLQRIYKISIEVLQMLYETQQGACAICKVPLTLKKNSKGVSVEQVDHNHTTGKVRGLLCLNCNTALGLLKDNVNVLQEAKKYLEKDSKDE